MSVADLEALLLAEPAGVEGCFLTVTKGSVIETVTVNIIGTTIGDSTAEGDEGALILFESDDALIEKLGGIASGMSGSPLYVMDGGTPVLVGAVAYGNGFTLRGMGLATPIGAMVALGGSDEAVPTVLPLNRPVVTGSGVMSTVVISADSADFAGSGPGVVAVEPLATAFVRGIPGSSRFFGALEEAAQRHGLSLVRTGAPLGPQNTFSTAFEPGAAMAALLSRGDLWYGGIGTTTYVTSDDEVVGFGHPLMHEGATELYLANAWIDGIWANQMFPFKLGRPGAVRGTVTQDRSSGVAGVIGQMPDEAAVTARAVRTDTGRSAETTSWIPRQVIDAPNDRYGPVVPAATSIAGVRLYDQSSVSGSAQTTTTITVSDGSETFTVQRAALVDSDEIVAAVNDHVWDITSRLTSINPYGISGARILSVDLASEISPNRRSGRVVDVTVPGGLRHGDNRVVISLHRRGILPTQTVEVTLTVPAELPLDGTLSVATAADGASAEDPMEPRTAPDPARSTLADIVADIRGWTPPTNVSVRYEPAPAADDGGDPDDPGIDWGFALGLEPDEPASVATASVDTSIVTSGSVRKTATTVVTLPVPAVSYRGSARLAGTVAGAGGGSVEVWRRYADEATWTRVGSTAVSASGSYSITASNLIKNATFRIEYSGSAEALPATATQRVSTRASVSLSLSAGTVAKGRYVVLSTSVFPSTTTGSVVFERYNGRTWARVAVRSLSAGKASVGYKASTTGRQRFRVRYMGGAVNAPQTSTTRTLTVR